MPHEDQNNNATYLSLDDILRAFDCFDFDEMSDFDEDGYEEGFVLEAIAEFSDADKKRVSKEISQALW